MKIGGGLITLVVVFIVGAWAGTKWPQLNLINKVMGS